MVYRISSFLLEFIWGMRRRQQTPPLKLLPELNTSVSLMDGPALNLELNICYNYLPFVVVSLAINSARMKRFGTRMGGKCELGIVRKTDREKEKNNKDDIG